MWFDRLEHLGYYRHLLLIRFGFKGLAPYFVQLDAPCRYSTSLTLRGICGSLHAIVIGANIHYKARYSVLLDIFCL